MPKRRTVLFPQTVPWDDFFQTPHQLARQFARNGWDVYYGEHGPKKRWRLQEVEPHIFRIGSYHRVVSSIRKPFDLKILMNPRYVKNRTFAKAKAFKTIWMLFDSFPHWRPYERKAALRSNRIFVSSEALAENRNFHNCTTLRNAVPQSWIDERSPRPPEYDSIDGPIVLFCGYLGEWVDIELMEEIASKHNLVVVGGPSAKCPPNAINLGQRPFSELHAFYQHADVGILPFKECEAAFYASPIKMYECLGAGTPFVASGCDEAIRQSFGMLKAANRSTFSESIRSLIVSKDSDACRKFAAENTWEHRFELLMRCL